MKLVIYGIGKQAECTHYLFTHDSPYEVVAFCVGAAYLSAVGTQFQGLPLVAFEELTALYPPSEYKLYIAVGLNKVRRQLFEEAKAIGYRFASYIGSRAITWPNLVMGEHVFIESPSLIHPFVTIGDNVMILACTIGHHTVIGSHNLLSVAVLGGNSRVGDNTFIGMGAIINENVQLGHNNIIGAGSLIGKHTEDNAVYTGEYSKKRLVDASRVKVFK